MAEIKEIRSLDDGIEAEHNSWTSLPTGFLLLIEESPDFYLLIDDNGNRLLIE